ncbi:RDD family protein [Neptuniibacter sp. CAU 1671]|uniref:RDD family protein n=1 Tax=Neptuniibacter sp. CAU 1671 TaxID=3032593 RepID=UPI0023DBEAB7|nr:RDD family protein [Neptuniibacter sp. CAU 1671]MDF2182606.1 RDD family protein [Neptuniibacter sp. CAU 1671]
MESKEYAGFWIRVGASLIDMILIVILLTIPLSMIYGQEYWTGSRFIYGFWDVMLGYVAPFIATIWLWRRFCATPGKMATNLRVVDAATGQRMSVWQAVGRYFAYLVAVLPFGLGIIWVGIDKKKQGWHDKLAGTVVIRETGKVPVQFESEM